jgi:hypothetical protein
VLWDGRLYRERYLLKTHKALNLDDLQDDGAGLNDVVRIAASG